MNNSQGATTGQNLNTANVPSDVTLASSCLKEKRASTRRTYNFGLLPIPKHLQYDPDQPFEYKTRLVIVFGFASTMTVCNLYYSHPLLIQLAASFGVDYTRVANIPTLTQAGYATGLLLISPLGDLLPRRSLLLALIFCSALVSLGLALTPNLRTFEVLTFVVGVATVTPQVLIPLAADLAPPERRASAIGIVMSGLLLGILLARVLAGAVAEYTTSMIATGGGWRNVYFMAFGAQSFTWALLWATIPDWPEKNRGAGLSYGGILWTMAKLAVKEPLLIQCSIMGLLSSAVFTSFWVTLTFILDGEPYKYNTVTIGLFGLIGIAAVLTAPVFG